MNLGELFLRRARLDPSAPALLTGTRVEASFGCLADRARRLATYLRGLSGWRACPRLALLMENRSAYWEAMLASWLAGGTIVPLNAKLHEQEIAALLLTSGASAILTSDRLAGAATRARDASGLNAALLNVDDAAFEIRRGACDPLAGPYRSDAPAWIFYTSGTTGRAKGAMLSHANLLAMCTAFHVDIARAQAADRFVHLAPLSHGSGLYGLAFLLAGAANVHPESGGFDTDEASYLFQAVPRATSFLAPTMIRRLVHGTGTRLHGKIRTLVYGGAPMHGRDIETALDTLGPCLAQIYGQGETPMTISALARENHLNGPCGSQPRLETAGTARFATEIAIADVHGQWLGIEEPGEIIVKGPTVMTGYLDDPAASAAALREGWLFTGDIGMLDERGFLTLLDRSKDVIITGGSNVYPREVEEVILRQPGIAEVAVFGVPDEEWGEVIVCAYSTSGTAPVDERDIDAACLGAIARFKRPKRYIKFEDIPKTDNGKIDKASLRRAACGSPIGGSAAS